METNIFLEIDFEDWFDYMFENLIKNGFIADEEFIIFFMETSLNFFEERSLFSRVDMNEGIEYDD